MPAFVRRLAERDRALFERLALNGSARLVTRACWHTVTHLGGATTTMLASILPLFGHGAAFTAAIRSSVLLVVSHLLVQVVKRHVERPRPVFDDGRRVLAPDPFSFPSGHAAAALSVALGYGSVFTEWSPLLLLGSAAVGLSRVVIGVHYPADVVAGQVIAVITAVVCAPFL